MLAACQFRADPYSAIVYVFRANRAGRIKLLRSDGTGLCLMAKKLEEGAFSWSSIHDCAMQLTAAERDALLEGLDWHRVHQALRTTVPQIVG